MSVYLLRFVLHFVLKSFELTILLNKQELTIDLHFIKLKFALKDFYLANLQIFTIFLNFSLILETLKFIKFEL